MEFPQSITAISKKFNVSEEAPPRDCDASPDCKMQKPEFEDSLMGKMKVSLVYET